MKQTVHMSNNRNICRSGVKNEYLGKKSVTTEAPVGFLTRIDYHKPDTFSIWLWSKLHVGVILIVRRNVVSIISRPVCEDALFHLQKEFVVPL